MSNLSHEDQYYHSKLRGHHQLHLDLMLLEVDHDLFGNRLVSNHYIEFHS